MQKIYGSIIVKMMCTLIKERVDVQKIERLFKFSNTYIKFGIKGAYNLTR